MRLRETIGRLGVDRPVLSIALASWIALFGLSFGCATTPPDVDLPSAERYYKRGLETLEGRRIFLFFHDIDYPKAIEYFQEVIDNYPYSEFATLAELQIGDIHFNGEDFEEAQSYYQDFVELHPTHEKVPYAIYRNGLCSFAQMREADRDQEATGAAIEQFSALIERYPGTDAAEEARTKRKTAEDRLAEREIIVADFYFDRGEYHAAIPRYRGALSTYPTHARGPSTIARLGASLKRIRRYREAEQLFRSVLSFENLEDELIDEVRAELQELAALESEGNYILPESCTTDPNPACN